MIATFVMILIIFCLAVLVLLIFDQSVLFKNSTVIRKIEGKITNTPLPLNYVTSALIWKMTWYCVILLAISVAVYGALWWLRKAQATGDYKSMVKANSLIFFMGSLGIAINFYLQKTKNPSFRVSYKIQVMGVVPFITFWGPVATLSLFCGSAFYYAWLFKAVLVSQGI